MLGPSAEEKAGGNESGCPEQRSCVMKNDREPQWIFFGSSHKACGGRAMRSFLLSAMGILATMILGSLVTLNAFAQNQAAQVSGLVTDPSGSVVPNADLVVFNKDNRSSRTTKSNGDGYYVVALQPGNYMITVTAEGFKTVVHDG